MTPNLSKLIEQYDKEDLRCLNPSYHIPLLLNIIQKQAEALEKIIYSTTYRTLADNMELAISTQEEIEKLCENV